ncbi:hypothetical protein ACYVOZ_003420, partial [Vibrio cholerae]
PQNSNTTTVTPAAHWDWKRHALTVPLEAFVSFVAHCLKMTFLTHLFEGHFTQMHQTSTRPTPKAVKLQPILKTIMVKLSLVRVCDKKA